MCILTQYKLALRQAITLFAYTAGVILFCLSGCSSIRPFTSYSIRSDIDSALVTMPASEYLPGYDPDLATQWNKTMLLGAHTRKTIATEIDERNRRLSARKSVLLLIGSAAALATTIYSGVEDSPNDDVLVPLGVVSGTSLVTALPTFSQDDRIKFLEDRYNRISAAEKAAVAQRNRVEKALHAQAVMRDQIDEQSPEYQKTEYYPALTPEELDDLKKSYRDKMGEIEDLSAELRVLLMEWSSACQ